jgi:hypothetical protein
MCPRPVNRGWNTNVLQDPHDDRDRRSEKCGVLHPLGQLSSPPPFCRTSCLFSTALRSLPRELPVPPFVEEVETPDASFRLHELAAQRERFL